MKSFNAFNKSLDQKIIVRSSAIAEDGFDSSKAGAYVSILNIDATIRKAVLDLSTA